MDAKEAEMSGQSSAATDPLHCSPSPSSLGSYQVSEEEGNSRDEQELLATGCSGNKVVCPAFPYPGCGSMTDKSAGQLTDTPEMHHCMFPIFIPGQSGLQTTQPSGGEDPVCNADLCVDRGDQDERNGSVPVHEACDPMDIPIEVNAVLGDLPPPPPYSLVRGRRMRFLSRRSPFLNSATRPENCLSDLMQMREPMTLSNTETTKGCCPILVIPETVNIRWFILVISFIALCCLVVGIILGALKGINEFTGDDSLTIALLLIGVGIILLTVSGIAWRLTAKQSPEMSLRNMLGFGTLRPTSPSLQSYRQMSGGPFSAYVLRNSLRGPCPGYYYEFQFRPPPPPYQAAVTDYRHIAQSQTEVALRTPPPHYRSVVNSNDPLPILAQIHHLPAIQEHSHTAPLPRAASREAGTRTSDSRLPERSLGHVNRVFDDGHLNYSLPQSVDTRERVHQRPTTSSANSTKRQNSNGPEFLAHL